MKPTISTLITFSVLGLVTPPAGALDLGATFMALPAPTMTPEIRPRNCDRSQHLREGEAGIKAPRLESLLCRT
jgi:hypothetical protein